jgi:peptidoglycan hydrolase-like protein with peptidoglycan-binding domain
MKQSAVTAIAAIALPLAAVVPALAQQTGAQSPPPASAQATTPISLTHDQIVQLQQALNDAGFDAGEVDGVFGAKTTEALKRFQTKAGLKATGHIDQQTLALVGMSAPQAPSGTSPTTGQGSSAQPANPSPQTPSTPKRD